MAERVASKCVELLGGVGFTKDFYSEPQSLKELTDEQVAARRRALNLRCSGFDVPRPLQRFES